MKRPSSFLPDSLPPVGVNREQAAAFVGVGASLFDRLVYAHMMPEPRVIAGRLVWDVEELVTAFRALPHRSVPTSGPVDARSAERDAWS